MGWNKWRAVLRGQEAGKAEQKEVHGGAGSKALVVANGHRLELEAEIQDALFSVSKSSAILETTKRSASQQRELEASDHYELEYKADIEPIESAADLAHFFRGKLYEEKGEWKRAIAQYMAFSNQMKDNENLHEMMINLQLSNFFNSFCDNLSDIVYTKNIKESCLMLKLSKKLT